MRTSWYSKEALCYWVFLSDYITILAGKATASSPKFHFCWNLRHSSEVQLMPQLAARGESMLLLQLGLRQPWRMLQRHTIWQVWVVGAEAVDEAELCGDRFCRLCGLLGNLQRTNCIQYMAKQINGLLESNTVMKGLEGLLKCDRKKTSSWSFHTTWTIIRKPLCETKCKSALNHLLRQTFAHYRLHSCR